MKTLSALALVAAVGFSSNAQIADAPIIIPKGGSSMYRNFIFKEFNLNNPATFYISSYSYDNSDYGNVPTLEYTVRLFDENLAPVKSFALELKSVQPNSSMLQNYVYLFPMNFNLCDDRGDYDTQIFTRTLFNTDDKLEYAVVDEEQEIDNVNYPEFRGFKIMSEDGSILQKITLPDGYYISADVEPYIYMSGSANFIGFRSDNENGSEALLFYRIDNGAGSVNFVMAMPAPMSVRSGDGVVTIDLPADADYSVVELVDMSGRKMGAVPVSGDRVMVDTSGLARGTYVLRASGASGGECAKIVVR